MYLKYELLTAYHRGNPMLIGRCPQDLYEVKWDRINYEHQLRDSSKSFIFLASPMQIKPHCSVHGSFNANRNTLFIPRIFQCKSGYAVHSTDLKCKSRHGVHSKDLPMQIKPHCSVHGSYNANRDKLFIPRIFQCKSSHTVHSTDLPMQIRTRCYW